MTRRYTVSLYYGVLFFGQNDIMPKNKMGYLFCVGALIVSAVLNAIIFGDIANLVYALNVEETTI